MRQCVLVWLASLFLLAGCRQGVGDSPGLVGLDSLIAAAPDSAAARLAAWPADSLRTAADRAYHALLLTQARYKAYIPLDSGSLDTVNVAVAHYADGHDPEKQTRSLLYKGCVMEELARPDSAMYCYKAAEDHAARSGDDYQRGYALMRMASLYQKQQSQQTNRLAAQKYAMALDCFKAAADGSNQLYCLLELSSLIYPFEADSAAVFLRQAKRMAQERGDLRSFYTARQVEAQILLDKGKDGQAKDVSLEVLSHTDDPIDLYCCLMTASQCYSHLGMTDSARLLLTMAPPPATSRDSLIYFRTVAELKQATHDLESYVVNSERVVNTLGTRENHAVIRGLALFEKKIDIEFSKNKNRTQHGRMARLIIILTVLAGIMACTIWRQRTKRQRMQMQAASLAAELDNLNAKLNELHSRQARETVQMSESMQQHEMEQPCLKGTLQCEGKDSPKVQQSLNAVEARKQQAQPDADLLGLTESWVCMLVKYVNKVNSKKMKDLDLRDNINKEIFSEDMFASLAHYVDTKFDGMVSKVVSADAELPQRDVNVICMHFSGFSNASIRAYMGTTDDHYVSTRKRIIAKRILHNSEKIDDLRNL